MPIYVYQCVDCDSYEPIVAGLDDHAALCSKCGGISLRLDEDLFTPYYKDSYQGPEPEIEVCWAEVMPCSWPT